MVPAAANTDRWIEFVGGPFDGHRQPSHSTISELSRDVFWLVTDDAFRELHGSGWVNPDPTRRLTSVAMYELDDACKFPSYRYVGSIGANSFNDVIRDLK